MRIAKISWLALFSMSAATFLGFGRTGGQEPQTRERIQVHAVVTDSAGKVVEGLGKDNFILTENGAPQPIDSLSMETSDSRAIVLFVDTAHISSDGIERVRMALRSFLDEQAAGPDRVILITSSGKPGASGEFSTNHGKLKEDMNRIRSGFTQFESFLTPVLCGNVVRRDPQAVNLATLIIDSEDRTSGSMVIPGAKNPEAEAVSKCSMMLLEMSSRRKALIARIGDAVEKVSSQPGQHMIALFTEGFSMIASGGDPAVAEVRPAISMAVRTGVMIYAFDVKVPISSKQANIESYSLAGEIVNSRLEQQHGMDLLAGQTGGDVFHNLDGLKGQMQTMLDSNQVGYRLAYYPAPAADARKFRSISVTVRDHPEYQVRSSKGFDMTSPNRSK